MPPTTHTAKTLTSPSSRFNRSAAIVLRSAQGMLDQLPPLAAKLVADKVDVIVALGPAVWAAKRATTPIPIIIAFSGDPVGDGVVASFARPGGNLPGFTYTSTDLAAKRLELFSEALSRNKRIGALYNTREPATKREMDSTLEYFCTAEPIRG